MCLISVPCKEQLFLPFAYYCKTVTVVSKLDLEVAAIVNNLSLAYYLFWGIGRDHFQLLRNTFTSQKNNFIFKTSNQMTEIHYPSAWIHFSLICEISGLLHFL